MTFIDVHTQAIEECAGQVLRVKNMLHVDDALHGTELKAPDKDIDSAIFGDLDGAEGVAGKIDAVWESVREDLGAGRNRLGNVERALGEVTGNFRGAEGVSAV